MTPEHIKRAIARAEAHDSMIDADILTLKGFSTGIQRRLISNLCELPGRPVYCEVGTWAGATACAAINNKNVEAVFFEDFSQPFDDATIREQLLRNLGMTPTLGSYKLIEENFFNYDLGNLPKFDVYYYDGEHSRESQKRGIIHAFPQLADNFILIVDDFDWQTAMDGTTDALDELVDKVELVESWQLTDRVQDGPRYHNGMLIGLFKKS